MGNDWIIDVLADLKTYARNNGLTALAAQLDDTVLIAAAEMASCRHEAPLAANGDAQATRHLASGPSRSRHAR